MNYADYRLINCMGGNDQPDPPPPPPPPGDTPGQGGN